MSFGRLLFTLQPDFHCFPICSAFIFIFHILFGQSTRASLWSNIWHSVQFTAQHFVSITLVCISIFLYLFFFLTRFSFVLASNSKWECWSAMYRWKWLLYHHHVLVQRPFIQLCPLRWINCLLVTAFFSTFSIFRSSLSNWALSFPFLLCQNSHWVYA